MAVPRAKEARLFYRCAKQRLVEARVHRDFTLVDVWSTNLRYELAAFREPEAEEFLKSADRIIEWAEGRI
jgi:hypothetical protein